MATKMYEASFTSVIPQLRQKESILADLKLANSGKASDASRAQIAEIELHIKNGQEFCLQNQYNSALLEFKRARGLIYKILYPNFDVSASIGRIDVLLPVSKGLEDIIIGTSIKIGDIIKPLETESKIVYNSLDNSFPDSLKAYMSTGFKEENALREFIELISLQAVSLLHDQNPTAAIGLMEEVLTQTRQEQRLDPELSSALQLNLAAAYMQVSNLEQASKFARASLIDFEKTNDTIGQAQALHILGVSASNKGDNKAATELLDKASGLMSKKQIRLNGRESNTIEVNKEIEVSPSIKKLNLELGNPILNSSVRNLISMRVEDLDPILKRDTKIITYRVPASNNSWGKIDLTNGNVKPKNWNVGIFAGGDIVSIPVGTSQTKDKILNNIYKNRIDAEVYKAIEFKIINTASTSYYLTHLYAYVLPVKIGDCYHSLGKFKNAEDYYIQATKYTYLNKNIEATSLWIKIALNAFEWGNSLYKEEKLPEAKIQYSKLINDNGTVPASILYSTAALKIPADSARNLITNILTRPLPVINWEISYYVLSASYYLIQIFDGLDYYGLALSPIHTFEYLQSVARGFAQEAIQAEREFVNFKSREEMEEASRQELESAKAMAEAEVQGRYQQYLASLEDEASAKGAFDLAVKRAKDSKTQKDQYETTSGAQIWAQAASQALGGGQDGMYAEISELADKLDRGETISGSRPKLAAAQTLSAGRKTQKYELQKMQDNIDELNLAVDVAKNQWDSAKNRTAASEIAYQAALHRRDMAAESLNAFDDEFFTPESWSKMADMMRSISKSYLYRAIRIAKLMERAYNFENDTEIKVIKNDYGFGLANESAGEDTRLLGGDSLLLDVESFTYYAITNKTRKTSRIKDVISLAVDFPAHFDNFRNTGLLKFETDLYEFDRLHPGFYQQRIEAIELEVIGLLSSDGLNGTLTAGGVTTYRKKDGTTQKRVHQIDTMALSDFELRNDIFLYSTETGVRGLFQGLGVGSTWTLHLPRRSNDLDFKRMFDVQLKIYYTAKFDPILRTAILAKPPRPDEFSLIRSFGLRYDFPDGWYSFYHAGVAEFSLERLRFPMNMENFKIEAVHFRVITKQGVSNQGIELKITSPSGNTGTLVTDAIGSISTENAALAGLIGGDPIGGWKIEMLGGASITEAGIIKYDRVYNIQMGIEYSFNYLPEIFEI
jgi:hypothetical protein